MDSIREYLRPIPDDAVPQVRAQVARGVRVMSLLLAVLAPVTILGGVVVGTEYPAPAVAFAAVTSAVCGSIHLASRSAWGLRRPEDMLLAVAFFMALGSVCAGWPMKDHENPIPYFAFFIPTILAAFAAWRPSRSLCLAPVMLCIWLIGRIGAGAAVTVMNLTAAATITLLNGLFAAAANQIHRRLWAELERTRAELVAAERMYGLGRLTAGIAHELKTPVAAVLNGVAGAKALCEELGASIGHDGVTDDDLRDVARELDASLGIVEQGTARVGSFVQAIREQTRSLNELARAAVNVSARVTTVTMLLAHRSRRSRAKLDVSGVDPELVLECDAGKLDQILTNLVANALDACDESGIGTSVRVSAARQDDDVVIAVEDDGPGVPDDARAKIFEPLYTTRAANGGSGLGLAIARDLAEGAFGGRLVLCSRSRGARFELRCPLRAAAPHERPAWRPHGVAVSAA